MIYRNVKNGALIDTESIITGPDWEAVTAPGPDSSDSKSKPVAPKKKGRK
jgi:hypothetical protein